MAKSAKLAARRNELIELSQSIEALSRSLKLVRYFANDDQANQTESVIGRVRDVIDKKYESFLETKEDFTRSRQPSEIVCIAGIYYTSAHAAAIEQANSFMDFLWFHLDKDGREDQEEKLQRTGFNPNLVVEKWEMTKAVILDRLDEQWREDYANITARIEDERARLEPTIRDPKGGGTANATKPTGPIVSKEDSENRQLVADRWAKFKNDYKQLGYKKASYLNAAMWMVKEFDDMPFLTEGLSGPSDSAKIGERIKALVRAHRETPSPKRDS